MSEDSLFFSQCHSVYGKSVHVCVWLQLKYTLIHTTLNGWCVCVLGVESLVRSLKETLGKANTEVQKQGLELLTAILDR